MDKFELLGQQIEQQAELANNMRFIYQEMKDMKSEVNQTFSEVKQVQESLKKEIYLKRGERSKLQGLVTSKSKQLARDFFLEPVSEKLYDAKRGHTLSYIWIVLKNKFDVDVWTEIPHIEFKNAMDFVSKMNIQSFPKAYYRLTPKMKEMTSEEVYHFQYQQNPNILRLLGDE